MRYKMFDQRGRGDTGLMSMAIVPTYDADTGKAIDVQYEHGARPRLGVAMRVGALYTSTFGTDTWWQTTLIKEIIEDTPNKVIFKTHSGSLYTWEIIE